MTGGPFPEHAEQEGGKHRRIEKADENHDACHGGELGHPHVMGIGSDMNHGFQAWTQMKKDKDLDGLLSVDSVSSVVLFL